MILSGRLTDWSVSELLQIMHVTEKTASLEVDGTDGRGGVVYFRDGRLVDAELATGTGADTPTERIVEAVYVLQLLADGSFAVGERELPPQDPVLDVSEAMELASRHMAAEQELRDSGLIEPAALRLNEAVESPVTLPPDQWSVVAKLVGSFSLDWLEARLGRGKAVQFINSLHRLGLVEPDHDHQTSALADVSYDSSSPPPSDPSPQPAAPSEAPEPEAVPSWWIDQAAADELAEQARREVIELERLNQETADDEAEMLAEAAGAAGEGAEPVDDSEKARRRRKEMRSLITPAETTLVPGVLDDLRSRFRHSDGSARS